jgi:hypothetical protein
MAKGAGKAIGEGVSLAAAIIMVVLDLVCLALLIWIVVILFQLFQH